MKTVHAMANKKTPSPVDVHIGRRIRTRRNELGISQEKLGDALHLTFQQVQKYEKGANRVGGSRMHQIAEFLRCDVSYFYEGLPGQAGAPKSGSVFTEFEAHKNAAQLAKAFLQLSPGMQSKIVELTVGMADAGSSH